MSPARKIGACGIPSPPGQPHMGFPTPSPLRGATSPTSGGRGKEPGSAGSRPSSPRSFGGEVVGKADRSGGRTHMRLRRHKGENAVAFLLAGFVTPPVSRDRRLRNALSLWSGSGWGTRTRDFQRSTCRLLRRTACRHSPNCARAKKIDKKFRRHICILSPARRIGLEGPGTGGRHAILAR